ncbi:MULTISPECIES: hypothetical protein [Vibrio]|uniref:hypothetical protein n=1 Tax=Vibrio TaxID=662 RepID=UPI0004A238C3|nr:MULTISPECIES: hypothetical protein [Vibrio]HCH6232407.1 hypothetical protein [Vibrio parahaemolyticus]EIT7024354.1 hypothetical protein [Vibrio vulnificus]EKD9327832.1 hypothetical protein [Vibrio vulnificus]ELQ2342293.1 hypothetical protein [Vibrio vulnificus]EME0100853.1 hypothetical protein [Vibrio vulnificus]
MNNIEKFEFCTVQILNELCTSFPIPTVIVVREIAPDYKNDGSIEDQDVLEIYTNTMHFLKSEGYLKTNNNESADSTIFRGCVLTSKGLSALHRVPAPLRDSKSLIEQLSDVKSSGIATASKAMIGGIVKAFLAS